MAPCLTKPLTVMSTSNLPAGKARRSNKNIISFEYTFYLYLVILSDQRRESRGSTRRYLRAPGKNILQESKRNKETALTLNQF
jgi:hypothetical protein